MTLTRLHLENFKKYTTFDIEFGEGLVGIIGKNGSGKSTLFEAILFALYGELQERGNKELVKNVKAEITDSVVVKLEFVFDDMTLYKVERGFRAKAMSAYARLYKNGELTTSGAKEVTNAIAMLTKMGKEAFRHTLFASQKELTSLSSLKNEDRKKMIRRLLGLQKIDFIEKELSEKSKELGKDIKTHEQFLLSEVDAKEKQEKIQEDKNTEEALAKDVELKTQELVDIKTDEQTLKKELLIFSKIKEEKQKLFSTLELIKNTKSLELLNEVKLIAQNHELEHKEKKFKEFIEFKNEYLLTQEALKVQENLKEFHLKKEGLNKELVQLRVQYTKSKSDIKELEKACEKYDEFLLNEKNLKSNITLLNENINSKRNLENGLKAQITAEQRQIEITNAKIEKLKKLGSDSACPICTRPLLEEYDNVINSLVCEVNDIHQKKIDELEKILQNVRIEKNVLEVQINLKEKEISELSNTIKVIESKLKDFENAKKYFEQVKKNGLINNEELKKLEQYSYDEKYHEGLKVRFTRLESQYKDAIRLEAELKRLPSVKEELASIIQKIEDLSVEEKVKETEFHFVVYEEANHKQALAKHEQILKIIDSKTTIANDIKVQIARVEGEIKNIQNILDNNEVQKKKSEIKKENLRDYEKIKTSLAEFKTKLNATVAPRISVLASEMYSQITKGKYQHIEVSNEFDFFIYDDGKKYPIERFSGGEIDLANLVLRIAISKTLTELSGTSNIGFLAFDEVFGSQDEARRMQIIEAFHTIKEQYRQIFLISHETEIKEMFERVIEL